MRPLQQPANTFLNCPWCAAQSKSVFLWSSWPDLWWSSQHVGTCQGHKLWSGHSNHWPALSTVSHTVNLVTQAACTSTPVIRGALQWIYGWVLICSVWKVKDHFHRHCQVKHFSFTFIKPLCATRWTVHTPAIRAVLTQYESFLAALEEMASTNVTYNTASRVNGLLERLANNNNYNTTLLGQELMSLGGLNWSLQARGNIISGMLKDVDYTRQGFFWLWNDAGFRGLYDKAVDLIADLDLQPIQLPHGWTLSRRYDGPAKHHTLQHQRCISESSFSVPLTWWPPSWTRWRSCCIQETLVIQWTCIQNWTNRHYKFNWLCLKQIMFTVPAKRLHKFWEGCYQRSEGSSHKLRLLLMVPVSSREAERSFSVLQWLKSCLRSTMTQLRLNSTAGCHVHRDKLKKLDKRGIATAFIGTSERRVHVFGHF